ncbi:beta-galactosidase trimerization domain-containing protein [Streptomyces longwoodensis]|uniref:beta-galactosidase trimerization domain-containing protein n=1 Tax=Streptomyces longwoodensis TaxID=68231 RepID=UPI003AF20B66
MTEAAGANLRGYVEGGGTLVVSYFSGIVDAHDAVHAGAHSGSAARRVLGLTVEEFSPLLPGETVCLDWPDGPDLSGDVWTEFVAARRRARGPTPTDSPRAALRPSPATASAPHRLVRVHLPGHEAVGRGARPGRRGRGHRPRAELALDVEVVRRSGTGGTASSPSTTPPPTPRCRWRRPAPNC